MRRPAVDAVRHVEVVVFLPGDPYQPLGSVVIGLNIFVANRPIFAESLHRLRLEIERSMSETGTAPGVRPPSCGAQPGPVEFIQRVIALFTGIGVQVSGVFINLPQTVIFARLTLATESYLPGPRVG